MSEHKRKTFNPDIRVGCVGLGIIGSAFSNLLLVNGFKVCGYDVDRRRLVLLKKRGGRPPTGPPCRP